MRIAFVSSNQHKNTYKGMVGVTEETVLQEITRLAISRLENVQGVTCMNFFVAGAGSSSIDELRKMVDAANAWGPDLVISLHSDAVGDAAMTGILPLVYSSERVAVGDRLAQAVAQRLKVGTKPARLRPDLMVLSDTNAPAYLLEISEHATANEARWLVEKKRTIGDAVAGAVKEVFGLGLAKEADERAPKSPYFKGFPDGSYRWSEALSRGQADEILSNVSASLAALKRGVDALTERVERLEVPPVTDRPPVVVVGGAVALNTEIKGVWAGSRLCDESPLSEIGTLAELYLKAGREFGIRADVAWAQAMLETGDLAFSGSVKKSQNNFCGLKTKDSSGFASFGTVAAGVRAHFEHLAWYVYPDHVCGCGAVDPRHFQTANGPHANNVKTVADLSGRWAEDPKYAEKIVARAKTYGL